MNGIIKTALRAGDLAEARRLIEQAEASWRGSLAGRHIEARLLMIEGELDQAAGLCRQILDSLPASPETASILAEVLLQQGRMEEARELFKGHVWPSSIPVQRKVKQLSALASVGKASDIAEFLEQLDVAPSPELGQKLAPLEAMVGLPRRALDRLLEVPPGELTAASKNLLVRLLIQLGEYDNALSSVRGFLQEEPDSPALAVQLCQVHHLLGDVESSLDTLEEAARRAPNDWQVLKQIWSQPMPPDRMRRVFDRIEAVRKTLPFDHLALWNYALAALGARQTLAACEALEQLAKLGKPRAAELSGALRSRPLASWTDGARFPDGSEPFEIVRVPDAAATLVVFPGLENRCHYLPIVYLDSLIAAYPVNVVYLRYPGRRLLVDCLQDGQGSDGTLAELRTVTVQLAAPRLVTMGFSGGGFAAIRYAALLGANAAISFSGPTTLGSVADTVASTPGRLAGRHLFSQYSARQRDVLPDVAARPSLRIWQIPGAEHAEDMRQAARLGHLPNVVTEPCPGVSGHATLLHVIAAGGFGGIVARATGTGEIS